MNEKTHRVMLNITKILSNESKCKKLQVGSLIVKDRHIISSGVNGSLKSYDNNCEEEFIKCPKCDKLIKTKLFKTNETLFDMLSYTCNCGCKLSYEKSEFNNRTILKTKSHIVHAEINALLSAAKNGISVDNSSMYVSHLPCINCAKSIITAGINEVYFSEMYGKSDSIDLFKNNNVKIKQLED